MVDSKMKLLKILDILNETDEEHPLTANQIRDKLIFYDLEAERRSICRDVGTLIDAGYDIQLCEDNRQGYYMASRKFEDWELKVMIDAVLGARFLTPTATKTITGKISSLASAAGRKALEHSTLSGTATTGKGRNSSVSINIDTVLKAIRRGKKIDFQYTYTKADMSTGLRKDGKQYRLSPYTLIWHNERYYVIGNYEKYDNLGAYRLDRMKNTEITEEPLRDVKELLGDNADMKIMEYVRESMYEYGGEKVHLTLEFEEGQIDDIADQFGKEIKIKPYGNLYRTTVTVLDGEGLYFWLLQYGLHVTVVSPDSVREKMKEKLGKMLERYQ
jgi:predicted DNA-binding transcriptional regulator YafY